LKKSLLFNAFVFLFIILFCLLGTWQLYRLDWKNNLITKITEGLNSEPILYSYSSVKNYQRFILEGEFDYSNQLYFYSLSTKSEPGFDVFTPYKLKDGNFVLVNRGWIKKELKNKVEINQNQSSKIIGVAKTEFKINIFKPENEPKNNIWFSINFDEFETQLGVKLNRAIFYLDDKNINLPKPREINADLPNNHLKYALTWYSIAISILLYFLYFRKKNNEIL
jgi:surfeit locus 1 family protein